MQNRPYVSLEDFMARISLETKAMVNLIKAGCFDSIEGNDRIVTMRRYITLLTKQKVENKDSLNMQNFGGILELDILPTEYDFQRRLYNFKRYIFQKEFMTEKNKYLLDDVAALFFEDKCMPYLVEGTQYWYTSRSIVVSKTRFDKWYETQIKGIKEWMSKGSTLEEFNKAKYLAYANEVWKRYCQGDINKWEMDSLSFYYGQHELSKVNTHKYGIVNFVDIPETPIIVDTIEKKKGDKVVFWDKYQLYRICGTVLDKNSNNHYITLLTTTGCVTVKFYDGSYVFYDKQVSAKLNDEEKKTILERSWFTRGNKLLITGIRRGNMFYPKRYYDSLYQHTVCLIEEVSTAGDLALKLDRERA